jgi:tRNA (guanine37-N1)-methyltransferase
MLRVGVVTLFPDFVRAVFGYGVIARAAERGLIGAAIHNPRDHTRDRHHMVDDLPYGGGPGMVMLYEPTKAAIQKAKTDVGADAPVICLTPQGQPFDQARARALATGAGFILVAGRYEGIDERVVQHWVDEEISIGDYVLSGGELPAMVVIDAVTRLLPGALGDARSAEADSFVDGVLDYPHYTRPEVVDAGYRVPPVLLSGDHQAIARWRRQQALVRTAERRPDLFSRLTLSRADRELLEAHFATARAADSLNTVRGQQS